ncbi:hypothetical protein BGZ52_004934 [Haplosporangium bisporale]|nr:hypothetical protein BGZ52_004934 [Haplosporangium bisporale]
MTQQQEQPSAEVTAVAPSTPAKPVVTAQPSSAQPGAHRKRSTTSTSRSSIDAGVAHVDHTAHRRQSHGHSHSNGVRLTNVDPALEGIVKNFMASEKFMRRVKPVVKATHVPGRQHYKFAPATDLAPQETKAWRMQLIQDEVTSNNPFWSARWMAVFGVAPKLDESLLKVPWIKCERPGQVGDERAGLPLHRRETYLDLRDDQNRQWAKESYDLGISYAQSGQIEDAIKAYSQAVQIDHKYIDAFIARGCILVNISKHRQAIMDFRQALALDPSNSLAQQFLDSAVYHEEQIRLQVAQEESKQAGTAPSTSADTKETKLSNIDNINELVLDTDLIDAHDLKNDGDEAGNKGNAENKDGKKKKKKNKRKRNRNAAEEWDRFDRIDRTSHLSLSIATLNVQITVQIKIKESLSFAIKAMAPSTIIQISLTIQVQDAIKIKGQKQVEKQQ